MNKKIFIKILYLIYITLLIAFIFGNSLKTREASSLQSSFVMDFLNNVLHIELNHSFVRKLAHFIEFFVLGCSLYGGFILFNKTTFTHSIYCSYIACIIALTDETIQYFTKRGSMVTDVWLDFLSALSAIIIFSVIYKQKKKNIILQDER